MSGRAATDRIGTPQGHGPYPAPVPRATPSREGERGHRPAGGRRGQRVVATGRLAPAVAGLPLIILGGTLDLAYHAGAAVPPGAATLGHLLVLVGMVLTLIGVLTAAARRSG